MNQLELIRRINQTLEKCHDKDWNYSRIRLISRSLATLQSPYSMVVDLVDTGTTDGKKAYQNYSREVSWGMRHSSELGILELISLRVNWVLLEHSEEVDWGTVRPVIRLLQSQELLKSGITDAIWYEVQEMSGEEFDNR